MSRIAKRPVALTIAGSDSGGGAGVQADLKTFAALGVHGASAITCLTAQNPRRVLAIESGSPKMVRQQIEAVFEELRPAAVKTGMLFSAEIIRAVADFLQNGKGLAAGGGPGHAGDQRRGPAETGGDQNLVRAMLPLATLVTPNLDETEILAGHKMESVDDMRPAAREIHARFGCATLIKGGHLRGMREAVDIFFDGRTELLLSAPFVRGVSTHGTGCTYSAAIAAALALGHDLSHAVVIGKRHVTAAIRQSYRIGNHFALGHRA